ncbi:MAG: hypothetical protein IKP86_00425 [Anaerolineaceae bacterium]|nr:hypothetical protein [Anaerolineaceae bacterium]
MNLNKKLIIFAAALLLIMVAAVPASADEIAFKNLISRLSDEGLVPDSRGTITSYGTYEDNLALLGYVQWFPLREAKNFVLSAKVDWTNSMEHPDSTKAGCGFIYQAQEDGPNHMMASVRLDGTMHISGLKDYVYLKYGNVYYGQPSVEGSADLTIVVNDIYLTVFVNGERVIQKAGLPIFGSSIGLATLSGTNFSWGTKCSWSDIYLYTW